MDRMLKVIRSEKYLIVMYLLFTFGCFFVFGVKLSHGGILGEKIVAPSIKLGELFIFIAGVQWLCLRLDTGSSSND